MNKHISQLNINNHLITNPQQILREEHKFYQNLYNENTTNSGQQIYIQNTFLNKNYPTLSYEILLNESKCAEALKQLKNGKTPGIDGLPLNSINYFGSISNI